MKRYDMMVKRWVIDKAQDVAAGYNCWISCLERDESGMIVEHDGYIQVVVEELLKETEKAVYVRLMTGDVQGSVNGWKVWIPKSQIMAA